MRSSPEAAGRRAGFTLVELLVALMIGGILTTVLLQVVQGSSRFTAMQAAREEVQQNGRAALDLIAADLRALPPSAIRSMEPNAVRFYLPRAWGVLCAPLAAGSQTAYVIFPAGALPPDFVSEARHWGVAVEQTTDPSQGANRYAYATAPARSGAGTECEALQPAASDANVYLTAGFTVAGALVDEAEVGAGGTILPGTPVMLFEEVAYDVAAGSSGPQGLWIRRMSGYSGSSPNMQPLAGPLPETGSLRFTYLRGDGTPAADVSEVDRIRLWVAVQSHSRRVQNGAARPEQTDTMTTEVILRNQ